MPNPQLIIRRATVSDARLIADLGARTFEAAFGADNSAEDMATYLSSNFSEEKIRDQLNDSSSIYLLLYQEGNAIGYALLSSSKSPDSISGPSPVELVRIYVETEGIGRGFGSALMKACLEQAKHNGYRTIWLGVWERNQRAIAFYKKWGFVKVGSKEFRLGNDVQTDIVFAKNLDLAD